MPINLPFLLHPNSLWLARLLLACYCGLIIYLSLMPVGEQMPVQIWDKAAHALAYIGFTCIAALCTVNKKHYIFYLLGFLIFGIGIELAQGMTSYRSFSLLDMVANTAGVFIGFILCLLTNKLFQLPCFAQSKNLR